MTSDFWAGHCRREDGKNGTTNPGCYVPFMCDCKCKACKCAPQKAGIWDALVGPTQSNSTEGGE